MKEEELGQIIEAISEDFSSKDLSNEPFMLSQLRFLLGMQKPDARLILEAAREVKQLRGDRLPDWALLLRRH